MHLAYSLTHMLLNLIELVFCRSLLMEVLVAWFLIQLVIHLVRNTTIGLFK